MKIRDVASGVSAVVLAVATGCAGGLDEPCPSGSCSAGGGIPGFDSFESGSTGEEDASTTDDMDDDLDPIGDSTGGPVDPSEGSDATGSELCELDDFEFTGTEQNFEIPPGARYLHIKAWGAGGNHESNCGPYEGGVGGYTEAVLAVEGGEAFTVIVGEYGNFNATEVDKFGFGGSGGGGLSGLFVGGEPVVHTDQARALVIAGGGGSAARVACDAGLPGNHPSGGGQPSMQGEVATSGGGGGYFGGLAGGNDVRGEGGSGFVVETAIDSLVAWSEPGDPTPPNADDPDAPDAVGTQERNGFVKLYVYCSEDDIPPLPTPAG